VISQFIVPAHLNKTYRSITEMLYIQYLYIAEAYPAPPPLELFNDIFYLSELEL
jgi:hypothetical protein